jgi:AAA+ ATPase superfamily predicted ATPase
MTDRKEMPSWIYILSVIVALIGINGIFAGWYSNALGELNNSLVSELTEMKSDFSRDNNRMQLQMNNRFVIITNEVDRKVNKEQYSADILRIFQSIERNGKILDRVCVTQGDIRIDLKEIRTIQKIVEEKLDIGNRYNDHDYPK